MPKGKYVLTTKDKATIYDNIIYQRDVRRQHLEGKVHDEAACVICKRERRTLDSETKKEI